MERILKFALPPVVALSESVWYNIGLAVVVVAVLFSAILAYRVYGEVNEDIDPASPEELLAAFEDARFEGELDEEEYQRVRQRVDESVARSSDPAGSDRDKKRRSG